MPRKLTHTDWCKFANSPDFDEQFEDVYDEESIRETKTKRKEKDRYAFKEESF
jgi:hypothetical protein